MLVAFAVSEAETDSEARQGEELTKALLTADTIPQSRQGEEIVATLSEDFAQANVLTT